LKTESASTTFHCLRSYFSIGTHCVRTISIDDDTHTKPRNSSRAKS